MTNEPKISILNYKIDVCPKCGQQHDYLLKVGITGNSTEKVVIFGGPGEDDNKSTEVLFSCLSDNNKKFTLQIPNPHDGNIIGVATKEDIALADGQKDSLSIPEDFNEWVKSSRDIALDYCKIMQTTSTGAIPVYFVVLTYTGFDKINGNIIAKAGIIPPIMFLVAAMLFTLALRPGIATISREEFVAFRSDRLKQINRYITLGTLTFGVAIIIAIVIFFTSVMQ